MKQVVEQHFEFRKEKFGVREFNFKRNRDPLLDFECRLLYYFDKQTIVKYQNEETIRNLLKELEPYRLTKLEKMLMVNNPPSTLVEIHSVCFRDVNDSSLTSTISWKLVYLSKSNTK